VNKVISMIVVRLERKDKIKVVTEGGEFLIKGDGTIGMSKNRTIVYYTE